MHVESAILTHALYVCMYIFMYIAVNQCADIYRCVVKLSSTSNSGDPGMCRDILRIHAGR